ncbi:MAG TPA: hypothetical protein VLJ15_00435 [Gammaproteobacteria bacterium]|nr:hypothetical protein [Gammaproteobacteria bacterium]
MRNLTKIKPVTFIFLSIFFIFLSHHIAFFIHEYAHAFVAWALHYKNSPFDINYGGTSFENLLLLSNVDQKVNNAVIYAAGHPGHVALIALAGPGIILVLFFLSLRLMQAKKMAQHPVWLYFLFFFNLWCLGGTYAYVPIRTFTQEGVMVDILDIQQALHISPWWIYFFVGYLVIFMMWQFFSKSLILVYAHVCPANTTARAVLMMICVVLLFGYCGLPGFANHGDISHFLSVTSFFAIPGMMIVLWPTREWVKRRVAC